jgi:hypothetical protein
VSEQASSAAELAELLDPVRAAELKRQRNFELARSLAGPPPPEADIDDDVVDAIADRVVERLVERLSEQGA